MALLVQQYYISLNSSSPKFWCKILCQVIYELHANGVITCITKDKNRTVLDVKLIILLQNGELYLFIVTAMTTLPKQQISIRFLQNKHKAIYSRAVGPRAQLWLCPEVNYTNP